MTYNTTLLTLYVNGTSAGTDTSPGVLVGTTDKLQIGRYTTTYFNGTFDELTVYNRTLSPSQILNLYQNRSDLISYEETRTGENWTVNITPTDGVNVGTTNSSSNVTILEADTTPPQIRLLSPGNNSNFTSSVALNYTATDDIALGSCWYDLNGTNTTIANCGNTTLTLNHGSYYITVYSNDSSGNGNQSNNHSFNVDTIAPNLSITNPANLSNFSVNSVTINFTVTDTNTGVNTCWYQLDVTNTTIASCNNFTIIPNEGKHSIRIYANDTVGNTNATVNRTFEIDTLAPSFSEFNTTAAGNRSQVYIEANLTANDINLNTLVVYLYNTTHLVTVNSSSTSPFPSNFSSLPNGLYFINATANDTFGNINSSETRTITLDTQAPNLSIQTPATNSNSITTTINLNFTATDNNSISSCYYSLNNGANTTLTNCINTTITGIQGTNYLLLYANDTAGNTNSSDNRTFNVDSINPNITIGTGGTTGNKSQNYIIFNVTAFDTNLNNITSYIYNSTHLVSINSSTLSPLFTNFSGLPNGNYLLNATANDTFGNTNSTATINVTLDTVLPLIDFTSNTNATGTNISRTYFLVEASVTDINFNNLTYSLYNSTNIVNQTTYNSIILINWTSLPANTYYYNATSCDVANNCNSTSTREFTVDLIGPNITIQSPVNNANSTTTNINLNFTTFDASGISSCFYSVNGTSNTTLANCQNTTFTASQGFNYLTVYTNDTAGNVNASANVTFTVDTINPNITFGVNTTSNGNNTQNYIEVNISASDTNLNLIFVYLYNSTHLLNTTNSTTSPFVSNFSNLLNADYFINATVNDTFGNSNNSGTRNITLNNSAPLIINLTQAVSRSSVVLTWNTDKFSNSSVNYSTTISLGTNLTNTSFLLNHSVGISNLDSSTIYYYNITVCNVLNVCNNSGIYTFTTEAAASSSSEGSPRRSASSIEKGTEEIVHEPETYSQSEERPKPKKKEEPAGDRTKIKILDDAIDTLENLREKGSQLTLETIKQKVVQYYYVWVPCLVAILCTTAIIITIRKYSVKKVKKDK